MNRTIEYKKIFLLSSLVIVISVIALIYYKMDITYASEEIISESTNLNVEDKQSKEPIKVDIKGAVKKPGVYSLTDDSRVIDAINAAGGVGKNGVTTNINLSKKVYNEMVIYVFTKAELKEKKTDCQCETIVVNDCQSQTKEEISADIPCEVVQTEVNNCPENNTEETISNGKININKADINTLTTLSGIGESKAKAIVEYRSQNGPFKVIEDIKNVNGLGEALFEKIKDSITV